MSRAWIALGSNLDDPCRQVERGLASLEAIDRTRLTQASGLYRSVPWGLADQPDFINAVAELETGLQPHALLAALKQIESGQGRRRDGPRWGPRTLDLDLLLYDALEHSDATLTLPHPRMTERVFVLLPLAEIAPELMIPGHARVRELLGALDASGCRRLA